MTFCEKVVKEIEERGIKKSELAQAIGIPYTTLDSMLRRNSENVNISIVYKIAKFLNVSVNYLAFDEIDDKNSGVSDEVEDLQNIIQKIKRLNSTGQKILNAYVDGLVINNELIKKE